MQNNSLKNEVFTNFICSLLQAKKFVIFKKRRKGKDGVVLSFAIKYYCQATYDLNVETIFTGTG